MDQHIVISHLFQSFNFLSFWLIISYTKSGGIQMTQRDVVQVVLQRVDYGREADLRRLLIDYKSTVVFTVSIEPITKYVW